MKRVQQELIERDLIKKLVFIVGPRQVGKTWLAKEIGKPHKNAVYLNYDRFEDRRIIEQESWLDSTELLILDELHKMPGWKNRLKGIYDTKQPGMRILVTGSARLDAFRKTGDSMAGRFFAHQLLPFSLAELRGTELEERLDLLLERGGFPEPLLAQDPVDADRWRTQYADGLVRTDILDFERIHDLRAIETVFALLRRSVGSPISYASLARDAAISPTTAKKYVEIFEALYITFRVTPFSRNIGRSLLKAHKVYFFDTGLVIGDAGHRFENLMAMSLLKDVTGRTDSTGQRFELHYLRTKDGREVDFAITREQHLQKLIEVKLSDDKVSRSLIAFGEKYGAEQTQVVRHLKREKVVNSVTVRHGPRFLAELDF
ncbi:MAG: ATP-binding protein [Proteobacteria bacterium]|nr:ATP-binding protein [Pseudomonadota bacterium]